MKDEILKNLDHISENDQAYLMGTFDSDFDLIEYFTNNYNLIMQEWHKSFDMFDIPSGIITISINGKTSYIPFGDNKYSEDTVFDIASMTKIYTEFILFSVLDEYGLTLDTKLSDITSEYQDIGDLTLMDLISFNNTYKTKIDIRNCTNKEEALKALRTIYREKDKENNYLYTDLPIMVLTDVLELYTNMSYKELFEKYITNKFGFTETYLDIKDNPNYVTLNKNYVNDPKANIFGGYYGHGGVKTTSKEFIEFMNHVFDSKYRDLFTTLTKTYNNDGSKCMNKALIGNFNLSVSDDNSLASRFLPSSGFAIQGSVRCHGETCIFYINGEEYRVSSSILMDLYTQYDNIKKYEEKKNTKISKEYTLDNGEKLVMCDVRSLLSYKETYKSITNLVGMCRALELYKELEKMVEDERVFR